METLRLPALQIHGDCSDIGTGMVPNDHSPSLRRRRFKMRRTKNVECEREGPQVGGAMRRAGSGPSSAPSSTSKEYLQLPSIEITPSSDEDAPWSNCSTPSASPRRKRCLLKKWLRVREKKDGSESRSVRVPGGPRGLHLHLSVELQTSLSTSRHFTFYLSFIWSVQTDTLMMHPGCWVLSVY